MMKKELLRILAGFEDDVEVAIVVSGKEPLEIKKVSTDGEGNVYLEAA